MVDYSVDPRHTGHSVLSLLDGAEQCIIIAPFVTLDGIEPILNVIDSNAEITLYTRWRVNEVAAGVSDPRVHDSISSRAGKVYLHPALHAKVYLSPVRGALVGSSNTTALGLGWHQAHNLEVLVEIDADDPSVHGLLRMLQSFSSTATSTIRDQILQLAELFEGIDQDSSSISLGSGGEQVDTITWLPSYSQPEALWRVYNGERDVSVTNLAMPDLVALDPPPGLSEAQFNAYVGSIMQQGFTGVIANRLRNLTTYQAIEELDRITADVGIELDNPERAWKVIVNWLTHFLPNEYTRAPGGRALYG